MEYKLTIDEYYLKPGEIDGLESFIKDRGFIVPNMDDQHRFGWQFTEAYSIVDPNTEQLDKICGRIIHYPWAGALARGLHVFRGTRLEKIVKYYMAEINIKS